MKQEKMVRLLKRNKHTIVATIVGGLAGWLYWRFVGCASGSCAITSNPLKSTIYGALLMGLLPNIFEHTKGNKKE